MTDTGKLYWSAIKTFGVDLQLAVAIEEMAELTKELCKKCGASDCEWDAETDVCTCKACGYTN